MTEFNAAFPVEVNAADMILDPPVTRAAGVYSETVHLPAQQFTPGSYRLDLTGEWPRLWTSLNLTLKQLTATVRVGQMPVGTATLTGPQSLQLEMPPFRIDRAQTLPVQVELTFSIQQSQATGPQDQGGWALRPSTTGCASAPDAANLDIQQMTLEAWVYFEGMTRDVRVRGGEWEAPILAKGAPQGYYLRLTGDSGNRSFADFSVAGEFSVGRAGIVPYRKWTHIAVTCDGHSSRIYPNSVPAAMDVRRGPPAPGSRVHAEGSPLVIGCRDPGTPEQAVFNGFITGVRIWNKVLTVDDLRIEAGPHPLRDTSAGLIGSWSFQSLVRGMVLDLSEGGNNLAAKTLQRIPRDIGPPIRADWISGQNLLRAVRISRVTPAVFPVTVRATGMAGTPGTEQTTGAYSEMVRLPDQQFTPAVYTLSFTGDWPRPDASLAYTTLTAKVVVGQAAVGTTTLTSKQPLVFTTAPFRIERAETLPVEIALTFTVPEQASGQGWALHPPANGYAVAPDAPRLDVQRLTVEAWVYLEEMNEPPPELRARGGEGEAPILDKGDHRGYYLRLVRDNHGRIFGDLSVAGKFSVGRAGFVPLRTWTHIAATYHGHEARIYQNGIAAPPERSPRHDGTVHAEGAPLAVGYWYSSASSTGCGSGTGSCLRRRFRPKRVSFRSPTRARGSSVPGRSSRSSAAWSRI